QPIRLYSMVGGRAPAYAVATGKALLAHQPDAFFTQHTDALIAHTKVTCTSLAMLRKELLRSRRQGYAINRGEWREGVGGVAVAVFNHLGEPAAAVGISGPLDRLTSGQMKKFAPAVIQCAKAISHNMGYRAEQI